MGIRNVLWLISFFLTISSTVFSQAGAFDWKQLHEQAGTMTDPQAITVPQGEDREAALYKTALVYLNIHRDPDAYKLFEQIRARDPGSLPAAWGVAEVLRRQDHVVESRQMLEKIIVADPSFVPAMISLAYIKYQAFDFIGAVNLGMKAIGYGPHKMDTSNYARAYLLTAGAKGMVAHYGGPVSKLVHGTKVYSFLKKAERLQPDSALAAFGLGAFYLLAPSVIGGDLSMAERYLQRAVQIDPLLADAYARLAQVYKRKHDPKKYKEYLAKALRIDPRNDLALDIQSNACKYICVPQD